MSTEREAGRGPSSGEGERSSYVTRSPDSPPSGRRTGRGGPTPPERTPAPAATRPGRTYGTCEQSRLARGTRRATEGGDNGVHVVDAAAPGPAARLLKERPEPRVLRQARVRRQVGTRRPAGEHARALLGPEDLLVVADQIHAALEAIPVHDDANEIALDDAADGTARERLRSHVADAGAR